jgi:hypothetical protein
MGIPVRARVPARARVGQHLAAAVVVGPSLQKETEMKTSRLVIALSLIGAPLPALANEGWARPAEEHRSANRHWSMGVSYVPKNARG